ncbi:MAG: 6-pyruvoyl-tetrahydropterin synthase-related protein, partial [Candidatus Roizmanbacteria bacterium]|nr:6-pyruvoyl-tetrahydropterin synthase-related protein [Candidatus Roizmanbacteria bacterium]
MRKSVINFFSGLFIVFIITIPAFVSILNNKYFTMHDDQHIARLHLLVTGIQQGSLFPRWVDMLGFGHGYPLFNFYPPLIYYVASIFYFLGFSLIWSIKLMIISGFLLSAAGIYLLIRKMIGRLPAILGSTVYTYFLYHSITVYVRGALAEFFTLAILPFVFLCLYKLSQKINWRNSIFLAISFALLILTHPLIAFPSIIFIGLFFIFLFIRSNDKLKLLFFSIAGGILSLGLSAFFWLPSMIERKFTFVDSILTKELANYQDHYVFLSQLWYSPWGYGGSTKGLSDGMTYQLGKVPILFIVLSLIFGILYLFKRKRVDGILKTYLFILFSLFVSLFMMTEYSSFIWNGISFLWYIQFPWRFLTFVNLFIAIISAYFIFFLKELIEIFIKKYSYLLVGLAVAGVVTIIVIKYCPYFRPQKFISTNDSQRTSFKEIAWRISGTSYEFVPNSVKTTKTGLGTTTLAIKESELMQDPAVIKTGKTKFVVIKNLFEVKEFGVVAEASSVFQLNTYNFPGWQAILDGKEIKID